MGVSRSRRLGVSLIVLAAATGAAHAQRFPEVAPRTETPAPPPTPRLPETPQVPANERQIVPALKGIRFVGALDRIRPRGVATTGVDTDDLPFLNDPAFLADMQARLGKPLTFAGLGEITNAAIAQYRLNHHPLVDVVTPQQDVSSGVVQLAVIEFRVGAVKTEGNQWFSDSLLKRELDLPPGSRIDDRVIDRRIAELNDNPFRRTELLYQRGAQPGDTDILLQTEDRLPIRVYGGFQNNGTRELGLNRLFTGFNWGNAFWQDHQFNYQYTTSDDAIFGNPSLPGRPDDARFIAHSASYIIPLPWHHRLTFYGFYARSTPRLPSTFNQTGVSDQASFRYTIPLVVSTAQSHEIRFGYDFKQSNNNLEFGGAQVSQGNADIDQFAFEYSGRIADPWGSTSLNGLLVVSPGGITQDNNDAAFQSSGAGRPGATANYFYGQIGAERLTNLPLAMSWDVRGLVQRSASNLLSSEQFAIGGDTTVRGYDQDKALGDNGWLLSNELRSPVWSLFAPSGEFADRFQVLGFVDVGHVASRTPQQNQPDHATLSSVGVGFRYGLGRFVTVRADYGWQLTRLTPNPGPGSRGHLTLVVAY